MAGDLIVSVAGITGPKPKDIFASLRDSRELRVTVRRQGAGGIDHHMSLSQIQQVPVHIPITENAMTAGSDANVLGEADVKSIHEADESAVFSSSPIISSQPTTALAETSAPHKVPAPDIGEGWQLMVVERKGDIKTKGRKDRYWLSPGGKRFRSKTEIGRFHAALENTNGNETAAWHVLKSAPNPCRAKTNVACDNRIPPDLLSIFDLQEEWSTTGSHKEHTRDGYVYGTTGGDAGRIHIEKESILDVLEALSDEVERHRDAGEDIGALCHDEIVACATRRANEANREECYFLELLQDEVFCEAAPAETMAFDSKADTKDEPTYSEAKTSKEAQNTGTIINGNRLPLSSALPSEDLPDNQQESSEPQSSAIGGVGKNNTTEPISSVGSSPATRATCRLPAPSAAGNVPVSVAYGKSKGRGGTPRNTRMNRLWPDSFIFRKRVMKWCPPDVVKQAVGPVRFLGPLRPQAKTTGASLDLTNAWGKGVPEATRHLPALAPIPSTIQTVPEMLKVMSPHILEEGRAQVNRDYEENSDNNDFWAKTTFELMLTTCTPVERKSSTSSAQRVYEFGFDGRQKDLDRLPQNIDDLFVIHAGIWQSTACIGMIGPKDAHSTTYLKDQQHGNDSHASFRVWVTASKNPCEGTGWLSQSDIPQVIPGGGIESTRAFVMHIGSASDIMRQYEGMKSLSFVKDHLQRAIFCSPLDGRKKTESFDCVDMNNEPESPQDDISKPATIPDYVWRKIQSSLNGFQLRAIHKIMEGKSKENVALLQGPPGTGKTTMICHLVSALLNGACPKPGSRMAGVRVHIGKSISTPSHDDDKSTKALNRAANRILVCAASNAAVDELAWKIHKYSVGGDGKSGVKRIVRYGFLPGQDRDKQTSRNDVNLPRPAHSDRDKFLARINFDAQSGAGSSPCLLSHSDVVCATLSGLGSKGFIDAVSRDDNNLASEFDAVIIDEACQATEASCLIPLKYNPNLCVLVGDPQQLPAFVASQECEKNMYGRSLFERLQEKGWDVDMLHIQYRMHKSIVDFPSIFYKNKLITSDKVRNRPAALWHNLPCFPPLLVWNMEQPMQRGSLGGLSNRSEANFICNKLLRVFVNSFGMSSPKPIKIGIISFYSSQVKLIKQMLPRPRENTKKVSIEVSTVDGFQGRETDIVIISCVRSFDVGRRGKKSGTLGFLQDFRRVNVALTRARESLWVVGNANFLARDKIWKAMLDSAAERQLIASPNDFDRFALTNHGQAPGRGTGLGAANTKFSKKRGRHHRANKSIPAKWRKFHGKSSNGPPLEP